MDIGQSFVVDGVLGDVHGTERGRTDYCGVGDRVEVLHLNDP